MNACTPIKKGYCMIDLLDLNLFYSTVAKSLPEALDIMRRGINEGLSANKTLSLLKEANLGYQRKRFLSDYSLMKATDMSRSIDGYNRAKEYYDGVRGLKDSLNLPNMSNAYEVANKYTSLNPQTLEDIDTIDYLNNSGLGSELFPSYGGI